MKAAGSLPRPSPHVLDAIVRSFGSEPSDKLCERVANIARSTAIHEAGHAVAATAVFGRSRILLATIEPSPGGELNGRICVQITRAQRASRRGASAFCYAGVAAQFRAPFALAEDVEAGALEWLSPGDSDDVLARSAHDRLTMARIYAPFGARVDMAPWSPAGWRTAFRILSTRWAAVQAVAEALLEHGTIDGERIDEIVARASGERRGA